MKSLLRYGAVNFFIPSDVSRRTQVRRHTRPHADDGGAAHGQDQGNEDRNLGVKARQAFLRTQRFVIWSE